MLEEIQAAAVDLGAPLSPRQLRMFRMVCDRAARAMGAAIDGALEGRGLCRDDFPGFPWGEYVRLVGDPTHRYENIESQAGGEERPEQANGGN